MTSIARRIRAAWAWLRDSIQHEVHVMNLMIEREDSE